ncbi:hypothetical protein RIF29_04663 [Crotalaria pallida]|uniref:Late embryogenesis abundant protein LEA-2 subgroup domain-containing protein n=1 Tax=Crotalaria pallida TaxID=3830 RepID=A0AAN9J1G6_CROPI
MAELQRSPSKPALVKDPSTASFRKSSRRVAFEVPSNRSRSGLSDMDISLMDEHDKRGWQQCYSSFCVWSCLFLFILILILLFVGIAYLVFLQTGLPKINVRTLNVTKLEVDNTEKMDAIINLGIRVSNKNEKLEILYGPLSIDVISSDVSLGNTKIQGFSQKPKNDKDFDLRMTMNNANVDNDAVDSLKSDIAAKEMVFDVYVGGNIGFKIGNLHMTNVPFLSSCHEINQMDVDFGRRPACEVKMFAFR